jgi:hypothetical protein
LAVILAHNVINGVELRWTNKFDLIKQSQYIEYAQEPINGGATGALKDPIGLKRDPRPGRHLALGPRAGDTVLANPFGEHAADVHRRAPPKRRERL